MRLFVATVAVLVCCSACARHGGLDRSVSYGSATRVPVEEVPVRGFRASVTTRDGTVSGELLAVDTDHVYVLDDDGKTVQISTDDVYRVTVDLHPSNVGWVIAWTVLGTGSTLSHGYFLLYTAPTWVAVGATTAALANGASGMTVRPGSVVYLWQFARFPGGLPGGWHRPQPTAHP